LDSGDSPGSVGDNLGRKLPKAAALNGEACHGQRRRRPVRGVGRQTTPVGAPESYPLTKRRQPSPTAVLLVAGFAAYLAFVDSTIVNIAFPAIQRYFHRSDISGLSWMLNAYNIAFAPLLVAGGRIVDLLGRKWMSFTVVLFTIASGLCAAADSVIDLVAFRVLQGIGAAILVSASLAPVPYAHPDFPRRSSTTASCTSMAPCWKTCP
jgi:NTE family protein